MVRSEYDWKSSPWRRLYYNQSPERRLRPEVRDLEALAPLPCDRLVEPDRLDFRLRWLPAPLGDVSVTSRGERLQLSL